MAVGVLPFFLLVRSFVLVTGSLFVADVALASGGQCSRAFLHDAEDLSSPGPIQSHWRDANSFERERQDSLPWYLYLEPRQIAKIAQKSRLTSGTDDYDRESSKVLGPHLLSGVAPLRRLAVGDIYEWNRFIALISENGMSTEVDPSIVEDIRYTVNGNKIVGRWVVRTGDRVDQVLASVANQVSSAMYRIHPHQGISESGQFPDFYPVRISRETIVPGTVLYDPAGHVLVVYKVEQNGRIRLIDAHPDNSLTRQIYGDKFMRASPAAGAGFKAFRPFKVVGERRLRAAENNELSGYSYEQQYGQRRSRAGWDKGKFYFNKVEMEYYAWVRAKLTVGNLVVDALQEFTELMDALCDDLIARGEAVNMSVWAGIPQKTRPISLPENIYGTSGEWETYSTPSRDARFKASVKEMIAVTKEMISKERVKDPGLVYRGHDLVSDMLRIYNQKSKACQIQIQTADRRTVAMNLDQALSKIFDWSFDPYHCPDLRWGLEAQELSSSCRSQQGLEWYQAESSLRRVVVRDYSLYTGFDLRELGTQVFHNIESARLNPKDYLERAAVRIR